MEDTTYDDTTYDETKYELDINKILRDTQHKASDTGGGTARSSAHRLGGGELGGGELEHVEVQ